MAKLSKKELSLVHTIVDQLLWNKFESSEDPPYSFDDEEYQTMERIHSKTGECDD